MANVGYATLQVIPSLRGVQGRLSEQLGGPAAKAGDHAGKGLGGSLMSSAGKILKRTALGVGAAAGAALSVSMYKGIGRLTAIENAQSKLQGLGHDAKSVQTIMDNALASVKGTAFGLGDAATVAASTVAAGIKPGRELERVLKLTGDTATIAGSSLGEMGSIFNKVAASNRLSLGEVNQLADRGVPILQMVAKQYKVTQGEAAKMVSAGKVDFATFAKAIEDNIAGSALKSGETTQGAWANMGAAAGRFGAALLQGVFPIAKIVFGAVTRFADWATTAIKPFGQALGDFFLSSEGPVQQFVAGFTLSRDEAEKLGGELTGLVATGVKVRDFVTGVTDKISQFASGFKMSRSEAQQLGGPLEGATAAGFRLKGMIDQTSRAVKNFISGWKLGDAGKDLDGLAGAGARAKEAFGDSWDKIKDIFGKLKDAAILLAPAVGDIATSLGAASANVGISTWDLLLTTVDLLASALLALAPTIQSLAGWMKDNEGAVTVLVGAYTAWKIGEKATEIGKATVELGKNTAELVKNGKEWVTNAANIAKAAPGKVSSAWDTLRLRAMFAGDAVKGAGSKIASAGKAAATAALDLGKMAAGYLKAGVEAAASATKQLAVAAAQKAVAAGQALVSAATKIWTGIQAAFNIVMAMNPLALIVIGIMLLVGGLILAYKKSDTFRAIVDAAFRAVGAAAKWLWENAIKPAWEGIKKAFDVVAAVVTWWWKNIVSPYFRAVVAIAKWLWDKIKASFEGWKIIFDKVKGWIGAFKDGAVARFKSFLDYVKGLPGKIAGFFGGLKDKLVGIGKNIVEGLKDGISNAWHLVTDKIKALTNLIPAKIREFLGIKSPSKVTTQLGKYVVDGLVKGLTGSQKQLQAASEKVAKLVRSAFTGSKRAKLLSIITKDTKQLTSLAAQRDKAQARLADIVAGARKVTEDVASKVRESFNLLDGGADGPVSVKAVTDRLAGALAAAKTFAANMAALAKRGLSKDLMQQLADAGPQAGGAMAEALAKATNAELKQLNSLSSQLGSVANSTGRTVADSLYGAGVSAGQGIVKGLTSQIKSIEAAMLRIAKSMQSSIKKALGIKSPSRVMRSLMGYVGQGAALGLLDEVGTVTRAARRVADAAVVAPPAARVPHAELRAGQRSQPQVVQHFHVQHMDPREVAMAAARRLAAAGVG